MARLQLLFVIAFIAIVLHTIEARHYEIFTAKSDKDSKCHQPIVINCRTSPYQQSNYSLVGWYFFAAFKSCHPLYSEGGVHHCKRNEDLPRTRGECEDLCAESCKMDNGTAGICMFDEYCKRAPHEHVRNTRPCKAYGVTCCFQRSVPVIMDEPPTTTTVIVPDNKDMVYKQKIEVEDDFLKIRRDIHASNSSKPLGIEQ